MTAQVMGIAVFVVGLFMILLGLADLLRIGYLSFGLGERVLLYLGGVSLCVLGYVMARRLPRVVTPPEAWGETESELEQGPPPDQL